MITCLYHNLSLYLKLTSATEQLIEMTGGLHDLSVYVGRRLGIPDALDCK